uniref:Limbic system associated membrane protein n=1 Tax=Sphaeramia orbicularis TaxID=375764 RepID=A0A673A243_9TELE
TRRSFAQTQNAFRFHETHLLCAIPQSGLFPHSFLLLVIGNKGLYCAHHTCSCAHRCYVDDKVSRVAWLNRSNIIFAGQDKWSLDPRVDLVTKGQLEYSLRIQKVRRLSTFLILMSFLMSPVPANIYKVSEDIIVNEGSNVTLTCLASGRPDPAITWRLLNPSAEPLDGEEYLDIIGIMRNQAGRYECKASNDVATPDVKYVNVVVNYPPTIQKTQSSETPVGRLGMLQCDANAVPKPEFEWYRDEKRMTNTQSINIQILGTTTILVFTNVSEEDYGNYTCVATNRLGIQNASVFLYSDKGTVKCPLCWLIWS